MRAGEVLEALRHLNGYTLTALAEAAGMSRTTLDAKRAGSRSWTLADVELFASVFEVPAVTFLFDVNSFWVWWASQH